MIFLGDLQYKASGRGQREEGGAWEVKAEWVEEGLRRRQRVKTLGAAPVAWWFGWTWRVFRGCFAVFIAM